jgi:Putative zinc- or iron-chelating domain
VPDQDELRELDEQTRRGSLFAQAVASEQIARANQTEAAVYGLIDLLIEKGALSPDEVAAAIEQTGRDMQQAGRQATLEVIVRDDGSAPTVSADEIDCAARIPYCKAACCKLRWPMTLEEAESGPVKWDLGRPFFNRHGAHGYCHQFDVESQGCNVYEQRPQPCRQYSCIDDARIWLDFENMVPNTEWIDGAHARGPVELFLSAHRDD